ncbi:MAG: hypothetical protein JO051_13155 [Acidobacteriaceae bacterium]|nr:hypothetical protein [Acidobacteriaceae bacterium]
MAIAAAYRQYAAECLQAAKFATSPEVREALLSMAQRWNEAADRWERNAAQLADAPAPAPPDQPITPKDDGNTH